VKGELKVENETVWQDDFMVVKNQSELKVTARDSVQLFIISSLETLPYKTYAETYGR